MHHQTHWAQSRVDASAFRMIQTELQLESAPTLLPAFHPKLFPTQSLVPARSNRPQQPDGRSAFARSFEISPHLCALTCTVESHRLDGKGDQ